MNGDIRADIIMTVITIICNYDSRYIYTQFKKKIFFNL